MCHIPKGFRDKAISLYSSKFGDKKNIMRCFRCRYLLTKLVQITYHNIV
jgi:hypothetical protein